MKNAAVLLLTVALLFAPSETGSPLLLSAAAAEPSPAAYSPPTAYASPADPAALLLEGLLLCAETVDLSEAALPAEALGRVYTALLYSRPELFHVAPRLSFSYTEITANGVTYRAVTEVYPAYTLTGEALTAARVLYRDTLTAILTDMEAAFAGYPRTEAETVLYLHDYLAHRYTYDTRAASPNADTPRTANADAYSFLRDGRGICQAYALTFLALCRGAGLEAELVTSDAMDHAWNHVRVEGVWYHVDVTRDDPITPDPEDGEVNHTRLLRSDSGMASLGYHGYTCPARHACTDLRYETPAGKASLTAFRTPLLPSRGKWIGVDAQNAVVGVEFRKNGVIISQVGDVNIDGRTDPADLLALLDPTLPEAWREWMRETLVGDGAP